MTHLGLATKAVGAIMAAALIGGCTATPTTSPKGREEPRRTTDEGEASCLPFVTSGDSPARVTAPGAADGARRPR